MSRLEGWQPQSRLSRWKELRKAAPRREALRKTGRRGNCDGPWERPRRQVLDLPASLKGIPWETGAPGNTYWYHASRRCQGAKTRQAPAAKASKKAAAKKAPVKASRKAARKGAAKRPQKAAAPPPAIPAATE